MIYLYHFKFELKRIHASILIFILKFWINILFFEDMI